MGTIKLRQELMQSKEEEPTLIQTLSRCPFDVIPSTLDTSYAVELADGRILETDVILKGYMLGLLGHRFDIDLMPVELDSFNVIVGMYLLEKYHVVIICDEKIVRIPYGDEMLIIEGDGCNGGTTQLRQKVDDKSEEGNDLKMCNGTDIFPGSLSSCDLPGLPPTRQVDFQINLVLGAALVERSPYCLAP
ncbi:hypothetical protein Tco_0971649 [Tanacetum coccineum]